MRWLVLSMSAVLALCLGASCALAQSGQWGQAEDQILPYQTHIDRRHGHDHSYPDRGAVVRGVPQGAMTVNYAGIAFRFAGGVWYQRQGPAYIVVAPPIGVVVPRLPAFATSFDSAGKSYLYANDVFYSPRPDLGGYEVVNDPEDLAPERSRASAGAAPSHLASAGPNAVQAPKQPAVQPNNVAEAPPANDSPPPANPTGVAIQPRNGQSADQQALDRYECYRIAVTQTGFDPLAANNGAPAAEIEQHNSEYSRVQAACLEGRGYAVP